MVALNEQEEFEFRLRAEREAQHAQNKQTTNPTEGMSGFDKVAAGGGKAIFDMARGAGQLLRGALPKSIANKLELPTEADIAESRRLDAPLMNTGAGIAGNIAGYAIPFATTSMIPGANTYTGAALTGGVAGALNPTVQGESTLGNAALGAGLGFAGQGLASVVGKFGHGLKNYLNPEQQRLSDALRSSGVPLSAADATGNKILKLADAAFENIPTTAGAQAASAQAKKAAFNRAVLDKAGISSDLATPDVLLSQKNALGKTFEDIAGRNKVNLNPVIDDLANITEQAGRRLTPDQAGSVSRTVDDILSQANNGDLLGSNYQGWRSELGRLSRGNDSQAHYFGQIKRTLDNAFNSQISGADSAAWKQASSEYGNLKTILKAMGGSGADAASGNVAPAQLASAVANSVTKEGNALGRSNLNDLAKGAATFLTRQVPDSGTAQRMMAQALLTGGAGYSVTGDPTKAIEYGAAGLVLPALLRSAAYNPVVQKTMISGIPAVAKNEKLIDALIRGTVLLPATLPQGAQ